MSTSLTTKAASSVQRFNLRRRRTVRLRRRPSSSGFHAWGWGWVCGSLGGAGGGWSRCLSWSTDPSRPGHRCRNGRHRPTARTLSKKTEPSKKFKLLQSSRTGKKMVCRISWMLPFLSPKSDLSSLTTPSAETVLLEVDRWFVILSRQKTTKLWNYDEGSYWPTLHLLWWPQTWTVVWWSLILYGTGLRPGLAPDVADLSGTMTGPDQLWGTYPLAPLWRYRPRSLSSPGRGWAVRQTRTSERQNIEKKLKTRRWVQTYSSVSTGLLENSVVKKQNKNNNKENKLKSVLCCSVPQVLKSLFIFCPDQNTQ